MLFEHQYSFIMLKIKNHPGKTIAQFFLTPKFSNVALFCLEAAPIFVPFPIPTHSDSNVG